MMYSIYHIEGVKIGVSKNVKRRMKQQGYTMKDVEVLEEHTDIYKVSDRELELQKQYGYTIDRKPYWKTIKMCSKGGKIGGKTNVESGHLARISSLGGKSPSTYHILSGHMDKMRELSIIANKKPILQYHKDGNFIKEWECAAYAARELGLHASAINFVVKGKRKTTGGYTFKYKE